MEEVTYEDIYDAISMASNMMDDEQIKRNAKEVYDGLYDELQQVVKEKLKLIKNGV